MKKNKNTPIRSYSRGLGDMVVNAMPALRSRLAAFLGYSHSGTRDTYSVFGYPVDLRTESLFAMYQRNAVANRIVRAFPQATWRDMPVISDDQGNSHEPGENFSEFAESVHDLFDRMKIMSYIERADRMSGCGRFALLVLGFGDGKKLEEPLEEGIAPLNYIQPYSELSVEVSKWGTDPADKMYGKPIIYTITQKNSIDSGSTRMPNKSFRVHASRCIHIAEFLEEDDVFGLPRLYSLYNHLLDLEKVVGGSAETFWLCANRGIHFSVADDAQLDEEGVEKIKAQADDLQNNLRRYIVSQGMTATVLGSESPDPGPNAEKLLDLIAGGSNVPKRILMGSERGELSSSQDENNWAERIDERRKNFGVHSILRPLINLLIATGNIKKPVGKWMAAWESSDALGEAAKADINLKRAQTLQVYVNSPGADMIIPPGRFCEEFLGTTSDVVELEDDDLDSDVEEEGELPEEEKDGEPEVQTNAAPMPLYVSRKVLNGAAIRKWAISQGFKEGDLVSNDELHVTCMYSKKPVDWMKVRPSWTEEDTGNVLVPAGGPRVVSEFGEGAIVLEFRSNTLEFRHADILEAGAAHSYPEYKPHITIAYGCSVPEDCTPYSGPIVLGPEIFAEIKEDRS